MKVLIADKFEQSGIDGLKAIGADVVYNPDLKDETLVAAIKDTQADVLVVRSTKVKQPMLDAGGSRSWCGPAPATTTSTWRTPPSAASTWPTAPARTRSPSPSSPSA